MDDFRNALADLINKYKLDKGSNTPDYILAEYLNDCLIAYENIIYAREKWFEDHPDVVKGI